MRLDTGATPILRFHLEQNAEGSRRPLLASADLAVVEPRSFAEMWQHVVDGLTEQIALLDEDWTILVVNQSWTKVAELYGHFALAPGTNYRDFCQNLASDGLDIAIDVVAGMDQITKGQCSSFQLVYRASEPEAGHDHQLCINRFAVGGRKFASITRYDVTRLLELRQLRRDFNSSVILGQAQERRRIGRELHDSTMQLMVCLDLKIGELERSRPAADYDPRLGEMRELVAETQKAIRTISYLTHPPLLAKLTLPEALNELVEGYGRRAGLEIRFEAQGETQMPYPAADGAAFRFVQEALSNIHRHAKAERATVRLSRRRLMMHVVVADNGIGMPNVTRSGVGLAGMRSRLSELGGRLFIRSNALGTTLIASIPINNNGRPTPSSARNAPKADSQAVRSASSFSSSTMRA